MRPLDPLQLPCDGVRLIEASAGTGKTFTIATLYLRLLLEREMSVRQILVVTFTEAATEELRDRIRRRMREALTLLEGGEDDDPLLGPLVARIADRARAARHLTNELTRIDEAAIFTIHGFCQRMLQENAFESGALFESEFITDEGELLLQVVRDFWRRRFYGHGGLASLAAAQWGTPRGLFDAVRGHVGRRDLRVLPRLREEQYSESAYREALAQVRAQWAPGAVAELIAVDQGLSKAKEAYNEEKVAAALAECEAFLDRDDVLDFEAPAACGFFGTRTLAAAVTPAKRRKGIGPPQHPFFDACQALADVCRYRRLQLLFEAIDEARQELTRRKQRQALLSFDDLLTGLADALHAPGGEVLAGRIATRFPVALIDEFQDTDPEQYRIFSRIYRDRDGTGLFMIGDPKQAIYSFRGADVFTYMAAKDHTDPDSGRFTLATNWRSAGALVRGINALFASAHAPFVYAGHIDFAPVAAAGKADAAPLQIDGAVPAPLNIWFVERDTENTGQRDNKKYNATKVIPKGKAQTELSAACAEEIVRLLDAGQAGRAVIGAAPIAPRDIAVLVRDRFEAGAVRQALQARGVASVYYSRDSVFDTEEAADLLALLTAVAEGGEDRALRAALCTALVAIDATALAAMLEDELEWEAVVGEFQTYQRVWLERGFMAMFRRLLHARAIPERLLAEEDGERRLTNLLQLAELVQTASREHHGIENLLHWFADQRAGANGESEEQQLRLESDEALVKIVTIHKSKGLEYPVVFLPFLWGCRAVDAKRPVLFHDQGAERELVLDLESRPEHHALAEKERLAEDLRLVYVALTRAKHRCYFAWGGLRDFDRSALAWLLHADADTDSVAALSERVKKLEDEDLRQRLEQLVAAAEGAVTVGPPPTPTALRYRAEAAAGFVPTTRSLTRRVEQEWHVASFSGLIRDRFEPPERPDHGSAEEDADTVARAPRSTIFQFPRGARAGTFMHTLFEVLDFPAAAGELLSQAVAAQLARHGYDPEWQAVIEAMVGAVLDTPLDAEGLCLRRVGAEARLVELEFHYGLARLSAEQLNARLPGLAEHDAGPRLQFSPARGVMRGFIDLVFTHGGRFYIADYKSNYLGPRLEDYGPEALTAAVRAHRYDLQYLIYTVALHRYLRHRLPDYDYERHFGGVYYLFLRGMRPEAGRERGVYFDRPPRALVEDLDRLFAGATEATP